MQFSDTSNTNFKFFISIPQNQKKQTPKESAISCLNRRTTAALMPEP